MYDMLRQNTTFLDRIRSYRVHLICWFLFISYEIIMVGLISNTFASISFYTAFYTLNIALFYFFAHQIMPRADSHRYYRYILLPAGIGGTFLVYYLITILLDVLLSDVSGNWNQLLLGYSKSSLLRSLYRFLLFVGLSAGYYYLTTFLRERQRAEKKEREQLLAEIEHQQTQNELMKSQNTLLKTQVNPHLLFNTLNIIFSTTRKMLPETADLIMVLSDVMHFSVNIRDGQTESPILIELLQVRNLIYLHQLRKSGRLFMVIDYDELNLRGVKIIPLVIITLVENMFKHADLSHDDPPAKITVAHKDGILRIIAENHRQNRLGFSNYAGLAEISKRLKRCYGQRVEFKLFNSGHAMFTTVIAIH